MSGAYLHQDPALSSQQRRQLTLGTLDIGTIGSGRSGRTRNPAPPSAIRLPRLVRPPPSDMMDARLRLVYEFLDSDLYENALFVAERLYALEPDNSSWLHLTALCYLRLERVSLALDRSREKGLNGLHLGCSYVFAQACLKQKNYVEGIAALQQAKPLWSGTHIKSLRTLWNVVPLICPLELQMTRLRPNVLSPALRL